MVPSETHPVKLAFSQFTAMLSALAELNRRRGAASSLDKAREAAPDRIPTVGNLGNLPRGPWALKPDEQLHQAFLTALSDNLDPSIDKVFRGTEQTEFEGVTANPPAEAHTLDPAAYPGGEPCLLVWRPGHQRPFRGRR